MMLFNENGILSVWLTGRKHELDQLNQTYQDRREMYSLSNTTSLSCRAVMCHAPYRFDSQLKPQDNDTNILTFSQYLTAIRIQI